MGFEPLVGRGKDLRFRGSGCGVEGCSFRLQGLELDEGEAPMYPKS